MPLTFASVPIGLFTEEVDLLLQQWHPIDEFDLASVWGYAPTGIEHLPLPNPPLEGPDDVGRLVWPTGMSRCAYLRVVVPSTQLALIQTALGTTAGPAALTMTNADGSGLSFSLYLVAAQPLFQISGQSQLHLLHLCDQRWFLRQKTGSITTTPLSWSDLFTSLASQLGITLSTDTIDADYDVPTDRWEFNEKPLAVILDAACNAIGHRLVANLDGTFSTQRWSTAYSLSSSQLNSLRRVMGGYHSFADLSRSVPASIKTVFLNDAGGAPHTVTTTLASLALTDYGTTTGVAGQSATINAELVFDGSNGAACTAYAEQATADWYNWRLIDVDATYAGIALWVPTAAEDRIEWKYQIDKILTRIVRPPFQSLPFGNYGRNEEDQSLELGCHLEFDDEERIAVTLNTLAGSGLVVEEAEEGCDTLGIDVGCALAIGEDNKLNVDVAALAGTGLTVSSGDCPTLQVDLDLSAGCGIDIIDEQINLDLSEVVGPGLSWDGVECTLLSAIGCGLEFDGDGAIAVDAEVLAGNNAVSGLVSDVDGEGCETLAVDTEVTVTETETLVNNVTLTMVAGKIRLTQTKTTYTNEFNAAGIIIDRVAGSPTDSYTEIDACLVDDCCNATELTVEATADPNPADVDEPITFTATPSGGVGPYTYSWTFSAGFVLEGESQLTDQEPVVTWGTIGSKTGSVVVTDACGRTATDETAVSVENNAVEVECCEGEFIPNVLYLTITTATIEPSIVGTHTITWNGTFWVGSAVIGMDTWFIVLECAGEPADWHAYYFLDTEGPPAREDAFSPTVVVTCDPFSGTFNNGAGFTGSISTTP